MRHLPFAKRFSLAKSAGFTLMETLLSVGLFGLLAVGILTDFSAFAESASRDDARSTLEDAGLSILSQLQDEAENGTLMSPVTNDSLQALAGSQMTVINATSSETYAGSVLMTIHVAFTLSARARTGESVTQSFARDLVPML